MIVPGGPNPMEFHCVEYYYNVLFVHALDLVSRRECNVTKGFTYVSLVCIVSIMAAKFHVSFLDKMALAVGVFVQLAHNETSRIGPLLKPMNSQCTRPGALNSMVGKMEKRI